MAYDPDLIRRRYDASAQKEWERLESSPAGRLMYHVHLKAIRDYVKPGQKVLELGAGSGRFSKDLALLTPHLTVTDLSPGQLAFNRAKLTELGLAHRVEAWREADICALTDLGAEEFDAVVCVGGPLNYTFDRAPEAMREMLRVLRPGGILVLGVITLLGSVRHCIFGVVTECRELGFPATDWLLRTGKQDGVQYPVKSGHHVHMLRSQEVFELCRRVSARVIKTYSGGFLATSDPKMLEEASAMPELWERLVQAELEYCESPGVLDAGLHMIFVVEKS